MHIVFRLVALIAALVIAGCGRPPADAVGAGAGTGAVAQSFEITVDGKKIVLSPDNPNESVVTAAVMKGGTSLSLAVLDQAKNLSFGLFVADSPIAPGDFLIGDCLQVTGCVAHSKTVMLTTYPDGNPPKPESSAMGYDDAELGLKPVVLTLTKVDDVQWPGVGPAKRIQGSFRGVLARVERNGSNDRDHVVGPLRPIEGRFDLYAALR